MAKYSFNIRVWCIILVHYVFSNGLSFDFANAEHLGINVSADEKSRSQPSKDFSHHTLIIPKVYHGREKRQISTTRDEEGLHAPALTLGYVSEGTEHVLDLRLNRELVPADFFIKYQMNGSHVINKPTGKDVDLCHYTGVVRGMRGSWAALSTCRGVRGVVFDGTTMHYLQPTDANNMDAPHFLYKHDHMVAENRCGYESGPNSTHQHQHDGQETSTSSSSSHFTPHSTAEGLLMDGKYSEFNRILRYKRSTRDEAKIRGPYNANKQSRYVELVLVVDNKEYKQFENLNNIHHHCKDIANIINSLYAPLNIFIALTGVVVWTEYNEIELSSNGDTTLTNFLHYRREKLLKEHPNDNAQLLTREQFQGGVVGKALKGPICTFEFSGGVAMDHSNVVGLVATTIAHEMGHNFGMEHDTEDCKCGSDEKCIMSPSSTSLSPTRWSNCSLEYLALAFEHGMDYCLRNKPTRLFDSPVCGNGFVEPGEQCDCGLSCGNNHCCDAATCMLFPNATCATGECCDLQTCRPSSAGTVCRGADHECDLPEYCTGGSEFCPGDVFKMDGETCEKGRAFCYHGSCRTRSDQCKLLWGPSGDSSDDQCYVEMNKKGSRHGNCGYDRLKKHYTTCQESNVFCGLLHCRHLNERLEFGMESVAILSHSFINSNGAIIPCRTAIVDLGLSQVDPGLVPDGAKCGDGMMCVNQKCMSVASLRMGVQSNTDTGAVCPSDCSGHGVCNSLGHCHCETGFSPPMCKLPGPGGSLDSGPASDPNAQKQVATGLLIFFLGIVPVIVIIMLAVYYSRNTSAIWWRKPKGNAYVQKKTSSKLNILDSHPSCFQFGCGSSNSCMSCMSCMSASTEGKEEVAAPAVRPKLDIQKSGLVSTTNEHVNNNFASYRTRVFTIGKSAIFGNREEKRASKVDSNLEYTKTIEDAANEGIMGKIMRRSGLFGSNKDSKAFPVSTPLPDESPSSHMIVPSIQVESVKGKISEKNVKGLKVVTGIPNNLDSGECSTASTYCLTPCTGEIRTPDVDLDNDDGVKPLSVKALREKLFANPGNGSSSIEDNTSISYSNNLRPPPVQSIRKNIV